MSAANLHSAANLNMRRRLTERKTQLRAALSKQPTPKAQRRVYILLALACFANCWTAGNLLADESLNLNTANFVIYSQNGGTVVGRSHYGIEHFAGGAVV
jgi:hypothetical protein